MIKLPKAAYVMIIVFVLAIITRNFFSSYSQREIKVDIYNQILDLRLK